MFSSRRGFLYFSKRIKKQSLLANFKNDQKRFDKAFRQEKRQFENKALKNLADLAEQESHHPFIHINYKQVTIILFTHKINGLHENDFIIAEKCDLIFKS